VVEREHKLSDSILINRLLKFFDYYLKHDFKKHKFNTNYFLEFNERNPKINKKFHPRRIVNYAQNYYDRGLSELINLASRLRPEISDHWSYQTQSGKHYVTPTK
jgi:hypothetical protein